MIDGYPKGLSPLRLSLSPSAMDDKFSWRKRHVGENKDTNSSEHEVMNMGGTEASNVIDTAAPRESTEDVLQEQQQHHQNSNETGAPNELTECVLQEGPQNQDEDCATV